MVHSEMFADIRQLMTLYDDVPNPETFAEHVEPLQTPSIQYGEPPNYVFSKSGECSRVNGRILCTNWCDETFPRDPYTNENVCDAAAREAVRHTHDTTSSSFFTGAFNY